jgi:hypothetical protein
LQQITTLQVHFEKRLEVEIPKGLFKNVTFVVDVTEYPVHNTCNKETSRELWSGKAHMPSLKCEGKNLFFFDEINE